MPRVDFEGSTNATRGADDWAIARDDWMLEPDRLLAGDPSSHSRSDYSDCDTGVCNRQTAEIIWQHAQDVLHGWRGDPSVAHEHSQFHPTYVAGTLLQFRTPVVDSDATAIRHKFASLVDVWLNDTLLSSSIDEICTHPAYQQIIGFGKQAIPLILDEVGAGGNHWGWALSAITGEDPAEGLDSLERSSAAWLAWGRERGYVAD